MTRHRLPAGTDVAEMALFDVDALPGSRPPDAEGLEELASRGRLIRLPTGGDGGYLLHLYVDDPAPNEVMRYCLAEDQLTGAFSSTNGRIAFGGVESAFQNFKPNRFIRSNAEIASGSYTYKAYRTDIPDEVVAHATRVEGTPTEYWLDRAPLTVTLLSLALAYTLAVFGRFVMAGLILVMAYFVLKMVKRLPAYGALAARRAEAQLDFPSIVIEMRSSPPIDSRL